MPGLGMRSLWSSPYFRALHTYTLQRVDEANGWRIALVQEGASEC
jgi:hypothetical protein